MLLLEAFLLGFVIKVITGIDDMLTRVPVLASLARTKKGKIAFSMGAVSAVCTATALAFFFSELISALPAYRTIVAVLIFLLAAGIYFDVFTYKSRKKVREKNAKPPTVTLETLGKLFGIGYIASFTTVLDDAIAYIPVFFGTPWQITFGICGIISASLLQAVVVIFFAEKIDRIPYKEEIAAFGLVVLGVLIILGLI